MLRGREHGESSVVALDGSSLPSKVVSQGDDVLLQEGDFVVGCLELPLGKEEVGPHLQSDLVCGFEDVDDFSAIGGQAVGIVGEGQSSLCLESGTQACWYWRHVLGVHGGVLSVHHGRTSRRGTIQRSVTGQAR